MRMYSPEELDVMAEAYDRALEAVQRGDPKGQTALELLRAAGPR